jgi:hypothetical protein
VVLFDGVWPHPPPVMPDFMSGIHDLKKHFDFREVVDARDERGHDAVDEDPSFRLKTSSLESVLMQSKMLSISLFCRIFYD